jgi:hypothetical protein
MDWIGKVAFGVGFFVRRIGLAKLPSASTSLSLVMIFALCVALQKPTVLCLGPGHFPHCGLPHGLSANARWVRGGVTWCIFCTMISSCMSW